MSSLIGGTNDKCFNLVIFSTRAHRFDSLFTRRLVVVTTASNLICLISFGNSLVARDETSEGRGSLANKIRLGVTRKKKKEEGFFIFIFHLFLFFGGTNNYGSKVHSLALASLLCRRQNMIVTATAVAVVSVMQRRRRRRRKRRNLSLYYYSHVS